MIFQSDMTPEQVAAVAQAMAYYLQPRIAEHGPFYDDAPEPELSSILAGVVRRSRGDAPWVTFGDPDRPNAMWFRLTDIGPTDDYRGGRIVAEPETGLPLGHRTLGPLVLHELTHGWFAQPINTGWNYSHEITW